MIPHTPTGAITAKAKKRVRGNREPKTLICACLAATSPATPGIHIDTTNAAGRQILKILDKRLKPDNAAIKSASTKKKASARQPVPDFVSLNPASEDVMVCRLPRLIDLPTKDHA